MSQGAELAEVGCEEGRTCQYVKVTIFDVADLLGIHNFNHHLLPDDLFPLDASARREDELTAAHNFTHSAYSK